MTFTLYTGIPNYGIASYRIPFPTRTDSRVTGVSWGLYVADQFRPATNVTVSLGLRMDFAQTDSLGYSPFDPAAEGREFARRLAAGDARAAIFPSLFTAYQDLVSFQQYLTEALHVDPSTPVFNGVTNQSTFWQNRRRPDDLHIQNTDPSLRLSVSWDPGNEGKTKLFATAGRYYDKIFLGVPLIELEPATTTFTYRATKANGFGPFVAHEQQVSSVSTRIVDRNLRTPFQDEWTAGVERELAPETSLKFTWIDRRFKDQIQDIDLNHLPADYGRCISRSPWVSPIGGPDGRLDDCWGGADGFVDQYVQNPGWGDVLLVGNFNTTHYQAATLELVRLYRGWQMDASYTWSKAVGDAEDFNQLLGNDRTTAEDERGFLAYDQTHVFKFNGTTIVGHGVRLGATIQYESGLPYSILESGQLPDAIPVTYGLGQAAESLRLIYPTGQRNDQRNPPFWTMNARVAKEMSLGRGVDLSLTAEVFNLLNDDRLRIQDVTDGTPNAARRFGRRWQMGMRVAF